MYYRFKDMYPISICQLVGPYGKVGNDGGWEKESILLFRSASPRRITMTIEQIIHTLQTFVPFPEDDLVNSNERFLDALMQEWKQTPEKEKAIPVIFRLLEKYPHANLGSPGPLVHALESRGTGYEGELQVSLLRRPTPLTLWMYNRIINTEKNEQILKAHISRLKLFARHPLADDGTREVGASFVDFQESRLSGSSRR
jgi:hypothetical protein